MRTRILLAVLLTTGLHEACGADDPWIGKSVLPMRPEVEFRTQPDPAEKPTTMSGPFVVLAVNGGWAQLRPYRGLETHIRQAGGKPVVSPSTIETNDMQPPPPVWAPRTWFIPLADAAAVFTARLARDPKEELSLLGRAHARLHADDDPDAALADLDEALRLNPTSRRARLDRALLFQHVGAYKAAIEDLTAIIKLDPKDAMALIERGITWSLRGDPELAIADVTEAIRLKPDVWEYWQALAQMYLTKGDADLAHKNVDAPIKAFPKRAELYYTRGLIRQEEEDYSGAIADFTEALHFDPTMTRATANRGWVWHLRGEDAKALTDLDTAISSGLRNGLILNNRGLVKHALGKTEEGLDDLEAALKADKSRVKRINISRMALRLSLVEQKLTANSKDVDALIERSGLYTYGGALDKAWADCEAALAIDPKSADAYHQRSQILFNRKDVAGSIMAETEAARLDPKNEVHAANLPGLRIFVFEKKPSADQLAELLREVDVVLRAYPRSANAYKTRATIRMMMGEKDAALADFTEAIRLDPEDATAFGNRAFVHCVRNDLVKALADQGRSVEIDPADAKRWISLSDVCLASKLSAKALWAAYRAQDVGETGPTVDAQEHLIFILSTHPRAEFRDGERAVRIALAACRQSEFGTSRTRVALAAAYAETGDFDSAVQWQESALLDTTLPNDTRKNREKTLAGFRARKPDRDERLEEPKKPELKK